MSNAKRSLGYRVRLNPEELYKLNYCSDHYRLKTSNFIRMFIDNCYDFVHKKESEMDIQNDEMDIQDYDFEDFDEYFPR